MNVDTGTSIALSFKHTHKKHLSNVKLNKFNAVNNIHMGDNIIGCAEVSVTYKDRQAKLPLVVVAGDGPSLLG